VDNVSDKYFDALNTMNQNKDVSTYEFPKKTKLLFIKRVLRRLMRVSGSRQQLFNNAITNIITSFAQDVQKIEKMISAQDNHTDALQEHTDALQEHTDALQEHADALQERADALQEQLDHYSSKAADHQSQVQKIIEKLDGIGVMVEKDDKLNWVKRSSSQAGEDSILEFIFGTLHISLEECDYIDLGANHPFYLSNTNFFYQKGAKGVLVEANPYLIDDLKFYRNRDLILNRIVSTNRDEAIEFYLMNVDGLSTSDYQSVLELKKENQALEVVKTIKVQSITVNEIMENYLGHAPKILNIDLEGLEFEVLSSIDFSRYRPLTILVEMIPYKTSLVIEQKNKRVIELMENKGYTEYAFTGINSIFVDKSRI